MVDVRRYSVRCSVRVGYVASQRVAQVIMYFVEARTLETRDFLSFRLIFLARGVFVVREEETNQVKPNGKIALQLHCLNVVTTF